MDNELRLFAAMALPEPLKQEIAAWMGTLQARLPFRRWVHPADLHITLQFLGSVSEDRLTGIEEALSLAAASSASLELAIHGLGVFGRPARPSVLWASIHAEQGGGLERLRSLHAEAGRQLARLGFEQELRPYKPHLTLAREYTGTEAFEQAMLDRLRAEAPADSWKWKAERITLYRSKLGARPMYEPIGEYKLGKE